MKDNHIYKRLDNPSAYKVYINMIKMYELDLVHNLMDNITKNASTHPKYSYLKELYMARCERENTKE